MRVVEERRFQGANCFLPVPAVILVIELDSDSKVPDLSGLSKAARIVNEAIRPLDNPFSPARVREEYQRLPLGLSVGEFVADLALVLQRQLICTAREACVWEKPQNRHLVIAYESRHPRFGLLAGRYAIRLCTLAMAAASDGATLLSGVVDEFKKQAENLIPTVETRLLLHEADRRGIPWFRLAENIPVVQLGQGVRRRRFRNSLTDDTGDTAYRLASYKPLAAHLLHDHGIPIPLQGIADTEDRAVAVAHRLGFPVVVKPVAQDMGVGVRVGIPGEVELRTAYRESRVHGPVQIERYLPGFDHRFTFIRGDLVGVVRTSPPIIEGDGRATIRQLLEAEPETTATLARKKVIVDEEVLGRIRDAGYTMDDVLPAGEQIVLRLWWRNQRDHTLEDVTAITHPDNIDAALLAVQIVGLDVAGADYITTDISRPFHETGGAFTEVNPMPAMGGVQRTGIAAYPTLLDAFFPRGETGRIGTAVLFGTRDIDAVVAAIESILAHAGHQVGIATRTRFEVAGKPVRREGAEESERVRTIMRHPRPTAAILQATAETVAAKGLAIDRCGVGLMLMPEAGSDGSGTVANEQDLEAAALVCSVADSAVVIDADDPRAPCLVSAAAARRILWVTADLGGFPVGLRRPQDALVAARWGEGDCVVVIDEGQIRHRVGTMKGALIGEDVVARGARRTWLMSIAVAIGMGIPQATIADAIATLFVAAP